MLWFIFQRIIKIFVEISGLDLCQKNSFSTQAKMVGFTYFICISEYRFGKSIT